MDAQEVVYDWDFESFEIDEFLEKLDTYETNHSNNTSSASTPTSTSETKVYNVSLPSTPKRKTFGAQMNEMRVEIAKLREEIAYRDAQLLDMYYLLYNKINKS